MPWQWRRWEVFSVFVIAASGGGDLLVDILTDLQGNILTRLYRNIQQDLRDRK